MQSNAIKPVHGEIRKTPARPHRWVNRARLAFGLAAAITFVLGFVLAPGWWVFTLFSTTIALMSGHSRNEIAARRHDQWLEISPASPDPRAEFFWGRI